MVTFYVLRTVMRLAFRSLAIISFLVFYFPTSVFAQTPSTTPISDIVYTQFGTRYNGKVTISLSTPGATSSSRPILSLVSAVNISNGVLTTALVPNSTMAVAGTSYVLKFGNNAIKTCVIPVSATPIRLADANCSDQVPSPQLLVNASNLGNGTFCTSILNGVLTLNSGACGSGGLLSLLSLSNTQLIALSNGQLLALVN